jgi:hypothetical protein
MVQTAESPGIKNEPTEPPPKWWWYLVALLSLGVLGSVTGQRELAQALREKARLKQVGPLTIASDSRRTTVNPARFEQWAFWGFIIGVLDGVLTSRDGLPVHGMESAVAGALATGVGGSVLALFVASLWNWAGRAR